MVFPPSGGDNSADRRLGLSLPGPQLGGKSACKSRLAAKIENEIWNSISSSDNRFVSVDGGYVPMGLRKQIGRKMRFATQSATAQSRAGYLDMPPEPRDAYIRILTFILDVWSWQG